jgi:hypothetical protein
MIEPITTESIREWTSRLEEHPLYAEIRTLAELRRFMEHHVFSVWDFMSLVKELQRVAAPVQVPWRPTGDPAIRRFINELVMEEESDQSGPEEPGGPAFFSHFELYCRAMEEIGADTTTVKAFIGRMVDGGVQSALENPSIPAPSREFTRTTFRFIETGKPHVVAAALALGREHIVPFMFRSLLARIGVTEQQAPSFHLYLNRHIKMDQDFHGPLSLRLLNALCGGENEKRTEALSAAERAVRARIAFWDGVLLNLKS